MKQAEYWERLEDRVTSELGASDETRRLGLRCDSLIPGVCDLKASAPQARCTAWICFAQEQQEWRFELAPPGDASDPEHLDWKSMLSTEDPAGWLRLDFSDRLLVMTLCRSPQDPARHAET